MTDDKPIWGIHMELHHGLLGVTESFIAIGRPAVGDLSKIPANRNAFKKAIASAYPTLKLGAVPVHAGTLYRFANEMKQGELIIYPSKPDRMVNLGLIDSGYLFDPLSDHDFPNRRKVRWVRHLPRAEFSQNALYEIGSAVTLFQIKNYAEEFLAAFDGTTIDVADVDEETVEAASISVEETTKDFIIKRLKTTLDPYQFERFIAHLLERMGYHTRVTQKSGDGGIDIIASKDELGFEAPIIKVQCKQVLGNAGQPEVAQLYGHIEQREHGLFVTLGDFTTQARQFERGKHNLRLLNGEELTELIFSYYDTFEPRYQVLLPLKRTYTAGAVSKESMSD
jgi:restriction system protein